MTGRPSRSLVRARRLLPVLAILAIATLLRVVPPLDQENLWGDEVLSVLIARLPVHELIPRVIDWEQIPPVHHLILHFWIKLFGDSETSVRTPSVIAGVAGVFVTYVLVRRLMGRRVALIAALLLAVSPMHIAYSRECRTYTLAVLVGLISMDLFVRLLRRPTQRLNALYVVVSALLLYTHLYGIFTIAAQHLIYVILLWRAWRRGGRTLPLTLKQWVINNVAVALLFSPWVPIVMKWTKMVAISFWVKRATLDDISRAYWVYSGSTAAFVALVALFVVAIWLWFYRRPHPQRRGGMIVLLALTFVPVVLPVVYSVLTRPSFAPRYSIIACVGWCAVVAAGIAAIRPRILRRAALVIAVGLSAIAIHGEVTAIPRSPWRAAARYLNENMQSGDIAVVHIKAAVRMYDYYVHRPDIPRRAFDAPSLPVSLPLDYRRAWLAKHEEWATLKSMLGRGPWYVVSHRWFGNVLVAELDDEFPPGVREAMWPGSVPTAATQATTATTAPSAPSAATVAAEAVTPLDGSPATAPASRPPSVATLPRTSSP